MALDLEQARRDAQKADAEDLARLVLALVEEVEVLRARDTERLAPRIAEELVRLRWQKRTPLHPRYDVRVGGYPVAVGRTGQAANAMVRALRRRVAVVIVNEAKLAAMRAKAGG